VTTRQAAWRFWAGFALGAAGLMLTLSGVCTASVVLSPSQYEVAWSGVAIVASVAVAIAGVGLLIWGYQLMRRRA
jgi:hypothetical protein